MLKNKPLIRIAVLAFLVLAACALPGSPTATPSPAVTAEPTPLSPDTVVLAWSRNGGIAGFCDTLAITADGRVTATTCTASFLPEPTPLLPEDWAELQAYLEAYRPYSDVMSDDAVADSMTVTIDFFGYGSGEAGEMEMDSLMEYAARIFAAYYHPPQTATPTGPCLLTANSDITVYARPSTNASVFGTLGSGESVTATHLSVEGWYGFDPGVAQAGNVGVFRLRWIAPDADIAVSGDCGVLPVAPVLSPTACYTMAPAEVLVYAEPDVNSALVVLLSPEGFASVTGQNADGWLQVDLNDSSEPMDAQGWVSPGDINFNGTCDSLPTVP